MRAAVGRTAPLRLDLALQSGPGSQTSATCRHKLGVGHSAERLMRQRIGQARFRAALRDYWQGNCPITGITEPELLRASHIIPWAECTSDFQRLDSHNGLLLAAHWDASFDASLISFSDDGRVMVAKSLSEPARRVFMLGERSIEILNERQSENLRWHRNRYGFEIE